MAKRLLSAWVDRPDGKQARPRGAETPRELYLDLLSKCLTRYIFDETESFDKNERETGRDWPVFGETMIGLRRLDNIKACATDVIRRGIPGDLIEAGVWRGGAAIYMRAILKAYGDTRRRVWIADSFQGLPKPDPVAYPADAGDFHWQQKELSVCREEVEDNFRKYGLLDQQVVFLPGWFKDSLPEAPIKKLSLVRIDADMYGSTSEVLSALYPRLSPGGYVIVDDYGAVAGCRQAVDDFRTRNEIQDPIERIDWTGIYWRRSEARRTPSIRHRR